MSEPGLLTPGEVLSAVEPFNLGDIRDVSPVPRSSRAHWLTTVRGHFVLSVFGKEVSREHLAAMQSVRRAIATDGFPVVPPVSDRWGRTTLVIRDRPAEIQPRVAHDDDARNWDALAIASGILGPLHDALAGCTAEPDQCERPWRWPATTADQLAHDAPKLTAAGERAGCGITGAVSAARGILNAVAVDSDLRADRIAPQLTHGDFQGPNILMRDNRVQAVVDFEALDYRPRLYDLAWPLMFWRFFGSELGDWTDQDWRAAARCCREYTSGTCRPPSDAEWLMLPLLMATVPAYGVANAVTEPNPVAEVNAFAVALPFAERLVADPQEALARLLP